MNYVISGPARPVQDTIYIPSSKSISNRVLVMRHLARSGVKLDNLSDSDDTKHLIRALDTEGEVRDVGHAGTAMRFLCGMYAALPGTVVLTGSERMKQRPIGPLVDALRQLGAAIDYLENPSCPPVRIRGGRMKGGQVVIAGGISSQFISALMMIAPLLDGGLKITLTGRVVSSSYIRMTLSMMQQFGVQALFDGREIRVPGQDYMMQPMKVESDWSAASYWYQVVALSPGSEVTLTNLSEESIQGDSRISSMFAPLGVRTRYLKGKAILTGGRGPLPEHLAYDFTECPDLVQTCATTFCALGIRFRFTGTETLLVKETDRIAALQNELQKFGYVLERPGDGTWIEWGGKMCPKDPLPHIETYQDHRMAMAFAPLTLKHGQLVIREPMVVTKSYPAYWTDLQRTGFTIKEKEAD